MFNPARLSIDSYVKWFAVFSSIVIFSLAGVFSFLYVFSVVHCSPSRASVFSHAFGLDMCSKIVMLACCLYWVVDWYCETHPRFVCQSGDYLRWKRSPLLFRLKSLLSMWRGCRCIWPRKHLGRFNLICFFARGWVLLIPIKTAVVAMTSLWAVRFLRSYFPS